MAGPIIRLQSERSTHTEMCWVPEYIQQKKEGGGDEEYMVKYFQRRPGRDGWQTAWSLHDRQ